MSTASEAVVERSIVPSVNPWVIAPIIAMAAFMEVLDISIANVSLQHISGSLSASQEESTWVLTSYLVANAIVLPISGWLSSVFGRKRFFLACIAGFTASSLLCGLAPNLASLIAFRAIQGLTGGGLQPGAQAILTDTFPPEKRGIAMALFGMSVVFAPAIGPTLGGWITDNFSWRWVFLVNVPVGILLLMLASQNLHEPEVLRAARTAKLKAGFKVDYLGFGLLAVGLGFLQVVLDKGQTDNWFESNFIVFLSVTSLITLVAFVFWELRRADPIVDLRLLKDRNFAVANLLMFFLGFILLGSTVLIPIFAQTLMGYSAVDAGLVLSPGGLVIIGLMPILAIISNKMDVRWLIALGLLIGALALFHLGTLNTQVEYKTLAIARIYQGIGLAFLFIPINNAAYANVSTLNSSNAAAVINLSRNLGSSVGISFVVTFLARSAQEHQTVLTSHATAFDTDFQIRLQGLAQKFMTQGADAAHAMEQAKTAIYGQIIQQSNLLAFIDNFRILGVIFIILIPVVFLMRRPPPGSTTPFDAH